MNMKKLLKRAQEMQAQIDTQMQQLQIQASSGGGAVTVTVDGSKKVQAIKLNKEVVDPGDVEMLEDLILAALNEAFAKVDEQMQQQVGGMAGGMMGSKKEFLTMKENVDPVELLIGELKKLPGIGAKSAQRIAFHLIRRPPEASLALAEAIRELRGRLVFCSQCNNTAGADPCRICSDPGRARKGICVVQEPFNVLSIEKTGHYRGLFHVLHGEISPINGVGPEDLRIKSLLERLRDGTVEEVILATNPTIEGEATALYLSKLIKPLGLRVSRIASGVPVGSDLEYADEVTLSRALSARQEM